MVNTGEEIINIIMGAYLFGQATHMTAIYGKHSKGGYYSAIVCSFFGMHNITVESVKADSDPYFNVF